MILVLSLQRNAIMAMPSNLPLGVLSFLYFFFLFAFFRPFIFFSNQQHNKTGVKNSIKKLKKIAKVK